MNPKLEAIRRLLETIVKREAEYDIANAAIKANIGGDFYPTLSPTDDAISAATMNLLNVLLDDDICEYFLYEARGMKGGGKVHSRIGEYSVKEVDDVIAYIVGEGLIPE